MTDENMLDFIDGSDDLVIADRLRTAYAALPTADDRQVAECQAYVAREAVARVTPRFGARRWWWGGAAAAAVIAIAILRPARLEDATRSEVDGEAATAVMPVGKTTIVDGGAAIQFELELPAVAQEVALVGDFNGWDSDATPMVRRSSDQTWSVQVPLTPGVHNYAFLIDGQRWMVDPLAPQVPDEGFGPANAVVVVGSR